MVSGLRDYKSMETWPFYKRCTHKKNTQVAKGNGLETLRSSLKKLEVIEAASLSN